MSCHTWFYRNLTKKEKHQAEAKFKKNPEMTEADLSYTNKDTPNDCFRVGHYPLDVLRDHHDFKTFVRKNHERIKYQTNFQDANRKVTEFFKNGGAFIRFG